MVKAKARRGAKGEKASKPAPQSSTTTDVPAIIDKAHILLAQSNFELAIKFLERALELEPGNLEARELVGVAELEEGDAEKGRNHLLHLFPPYTSEPPASASPYLYLAQTAGDPQEALGYYSTAAAMIENRLNGKGKGRMLGEGDADEEDKAMAVRALVAMIEIWMSDLCFEDGASDNCDALIARALTILPNDPEALMMLASIRMSQSKFDEAKRVVLQIYSDLEGRDPFDPMLPGLPVRLQFTRLLLEHGLHMEALDILSTAREEDSLEVESAYLEGWAWHLRGEALLEDPSILDKEREAARAERAETMAMGEGEEQDDEEDKPMTAPECFSESFRALIECAKLFTEQEYPDEGIGAHVHELIKDLEGRGIQPAVHEDDKAEGEEGEGDGDVAMA